MKSLNMFPLESVVLPDLEEINFQLFFDEPLEELDALLKSLSSETAFEETLALLLSSLEELEAVTKPKSLDAILLDLELAEPIELSLELVLAEPIELPFALELESVETLNLVDLLPVPLDWIS